MKIMFGSTNFGFVAGILAASVDQAQAVSYAASQRYVLIEMSVAPEGVKEAKDKGNGKFGLSKIDEATYITLDLAFADAGVDETEGLATTETIAQEAQGDESTTLSADQIPTPENVVETKTRKQTKANRGEYDVDFARGDVVNIILCGQGPHQKPKEGPFLCLGHVYGHMAYVRLVDGVPTGDQLVTSKLKAIEGQAVIGKMIESWAASA